MFFVKTSSCGYAMNCNCLSSSVLLSISSKIRNYSDASTICHRTNHVCINAPSYISNFEFANRIPLVYLCTQGSCGGEPDASEVFEYHGHKKYHGGQIGDVQDALTISPLVKQDKSSSRSFR